MDATSLGALVRAAKDFVPRPGCIVDLSPRPHPRVDPVQQLLAGAAQLWLCWIYEAALRIASKSWFVVFERHERVTLCGSVHSVRNFKLLDHLELCFLVTEDSFHRALLVIFLNTFVEQFSVLLRLHEV